MINTTAGISEAFALDALRQHHPKQYVTLSLGLQIPPKKVFWGEFRGLSTFSGGVWSPRLFRNIYLFILANLSWC